MGFPWSSKKNSLSISWNPPTFFTSCYYLSKWIENVSILHKTGQTKYTQNIPNLQQILRFPKIRN